MQLYLQAFCFLKRIAYLKHMSALRRAVFKPWHDVQVHRAWDLQNLKHLIFSHRMYSRLHMTAVVMFLIGNL
jgi:hypothetical protein